MEYVKQNLGLEVDSKKLKVALVCMNRDQEMKVRSSKTFSNNKLGYGLLSIWIENKRIRDLPVHITMEATGKYYENVAYYFSKMTDHILHIVLPNKSRYYAKSLNIKSKNDEIDAVMLGQFGCERSLGVWLPFGKQMKGLKDLTRERNQISHDKTVAKNRLHAIQSGFNPRNNTVKRLKSRIAYLDKQIKCIEKELKLIVAKDSKLEERINNVCTIQGVRFITAITVVAELNGFALIKNRKQLVSYCGLDVIENSSGTSVRGKTRISKKGNSFVRAALYMSAISHKQHNKHANALFTRIVNRCGIKLKGVIAVERKLLLLIYTLYKNNAPYDESYHEKLKEELNSKKEIEQEIAA